MMNNLSPKVVERFPSQQHAVNYALVKCIDERLLNYTNEVLFSPPTELLLNEMFLMSVCISVKKYFMMLVLL